MKEYRPLIVRLGIIIFLVVSIIAFTILKTSPTICEAMMNGPGRFFSSIASKISSVFPFSLTEFSFAALAIGIVFLLVLAIRSLVKKKFIAATHRVLEGAMIILLSISIYDYSCEFAYNRKEMPLPYYENEVLRTEHVDIYNYFADDVNYCISTLEFDENGDVNTDMTFEEIANEVKKAYSILDGNSYFHPHAGSVKPMATSLIYTEFQITGVTYSPLGEANINVVNPQSDIPFTIAHELAHTKGVMREDDANKLAFYVCLNSEHPYLRYSAYASYFYQIEAMVTSYYLTDEERAELHPVDIALARNRSYVYKFWDEHDLLGDIGEFINNLYIKSSGVQEGTTSYFGGTTYVHDPLTSKLIPSLYQKLFFDKYYRS